MLEGSLKVMLETLKVLDSSGMTYAEAIEAQEAVVAAETTKLEELRSLEGLSEQTTTRHPNGKKIRRDKGVKRARKHGNEQPADGNV